MNINTDLRNFADFANKANVNTCVEMTRGGMVQAARHTAGATARFFHVTANARSAVEINNVTRQAFVEALKRQFNAKYMRDLPPAVQRALIGTHAKTTAGDFNFDAQGNVTGGRPLTARRIRAVMSAIEQVQTAAAANRAPVTEATVEARRAALAPFLENLARKIVSVPQGHHVAIIMDRWADIARQNITGNAFANRLARIGTDAANTLEIVREKFKLLVGSCGVLPDYWVTRRPITLDDGTPFTTPGLVERERLEEALFNELIREFNAQNPELAIR